MNKDNLSNEFSDIWIDEAIAIKVAEDLANYQRIIGKEIGLPIYPDEIADTLWGVQTHYPEHVYDEAGNDVFGRFDHVNKIIEISTSMRINEGQVSFTSAHEVGHASMHDFMSSIHCGSKLNPWTAIQIEKQADKYANLLLMPSNLMSVAVQTFVDRGLPIDLDLVAPKLMPILKVSRQALEIRLGNLGYQLLNSRYGVSYERIHDRIFLELEDDRRAKNMV